MDKDLDLEECAIDLEDYMNDILQKASTVYDHVAMTEFEKVDWERMHRKVQAILEMAQEAYDLTLDVTGEEY